MHGHGEIVEQAHQNDEQSHKAARFEVGRGDGEKCEEADARYPNVRPVRHDEGWDIAFLLRVLNEREREALDDVGERVPEKGVADNLDGDDAVGRARTEFIFRLEVRHFLHCQSLNTRQLRVGRSTFRNVDEENEHHSRDGPRNGVIVLFPVPHKAV